MGIRNYLWERIEETQPEVRIMPWYILAIRAVLFPVKSLAWMLGKMHGYDWIADVWRIDGVNYTGRAMRMLAESHGELYRIRREGCTVTLTKVNEE